MNNATSYLLRQRTIPLDHAGEYLIIGDYFKAVPTRQTQAIEQKVGIPVLYLLSHYHSDHYGGICSKWPTRTSATVSTPPRLLCSEFTRLCLMSQSNTAKLSHVIDVIEEGDTRRYETPAGPVIITAHCAHHAPGSLMFEIETPISHALFTGDFRMDAPPPLRRRVTHLHVDTTFHKNVPRYHPFPPQNDVLLELQLQLQRFMELPDPTLYDVNSYKIGKERIAVAVVAALSRYRGMMGAPLAIHVGGGDEGKHKAHCIAQALREINALRERPAWLCGYDPLSFTTSDNFNLPVHFCAKSSMQHLIGVEKGDKRLDIQRKAANCTCIGPAPAPWRRVLVLEGSGWNHAPLCWKKAPGSRFRAIAWMTPSVGTLSFGYSEHANDVELSKFVSTVAAQGAALHFTLANDAVEAASIYTGMTLK